MIHTSGIGQAEQQRLNRSLLINILSREKICSRADLARLSGLKRPTITNIIHDFIEYGIVVEDGLLSNANGRRSIGLRINGNRFKVIGVTLLRTHYIIAVMGIDGTIFDIKHFKISPDYKPNQIINRIKNDVETIIEQNNDSRILAIGYAMPGPYKLVNGKLVFVTNLPGWENVYVDKIFQSRFDIPIFIQNDANAGAMAEFWFSKEKDMKQNLCYILAGQGIGCGIIHNGELMNGAYGLAGEIGHTTIEFSGKKCECGNYGCTELYCSIIAMSENISKRINTEKSCLKPGFTYEDLKFAIQNNDAVAVEEFDKACSYLATVVLNIVNIVNPKSVIIGDLLADIDSKRMINCIDKILKNRVRSLMLENIDIRVSKLEHNPTILGSCVVVIANIFKDPLKYVKAE